MPNRSPYSDVLKRLRERLRKTRDTAGKSGGGEDSSTSMPQPLIECRVEQGRGGKALKILLNVLPLVPFLLAAVGLERTILFPASIVLAVIAFLVSPFLIDEDLKIAAENFARILHKQGVLEAWACHDRRLFFVGYLKQGFVMGVFRRRLGIRYTLALVRGSGVILPPSLSPKPGIKVLSVYETRVLQGRGEPGLSLFSVQMSLANAEVVLPHPLNPRLLALHKGRALLVTLPSVESQSFLEERGEELLRLYESPRLSHPAL